MKYEIKGEPFPAVTCYIEDGETLITEKGSMCWMSPNMSMETVGGSVGKAFGRMFSGEAMFQNKYTAVGAEGMITFASSFPGVIKAFEITPDREMIVQKSGFLASETGVELSVFFQKKFGSGLFGGEGFIMQKLSGNGIAFVEFDGHIMEYELAQGENMIIDTGYLAAMESTCSINIQTVKGIKNKLLGGEGIFNTVVTGPGKIYLQTMPINSVASSLAPYLPITK
ncbi:TIGR00266 family protein [Clostridium sp. MSJ-8]|uniref:TIGR00266 family protein n=1 Tax=Clostridium sp. MSJ-8 TaxID=2841510 RepID=UPI001C0EEC01|nr:TIGR00266 family protein [Clostridium sp. MSJ-8]MBU5488729.1 TIGR00266 family protein [Clostridium sp. MSJ-8]